MTHEHKTNSLPIKSCQHGQNKSLPHYYILSYTESLLFYVAYRSFSANDANAENCTPEWSKVIGSQHNIKIITNINLIYIIHTGAMVLRFCYVLL